MLMDGLTVLDLTQGAAGPFCTKQLAQFGADVIKIEPPEGDEARRAGPFAGDRSHPETSALFLYLNAGKRSVVLDIRDEQGRAGLRRLTERAGALVESEGPGVLDGLGLSYESLAASNPRLVMLSMSPFGKTGPQRAWHGSDLVFQALCGPMYNLGDPEREPLKLAENQGLYYAGGVAAVGLAAAALSARLTGRGSYIDFSIAEALACNPEVRFPNFAYSGEPSKRVGNDVFGPYLVGGYPCKDGYIAVQGVGRGEAWWPRIFEMIGRPELIGSPKFADRESRVAHFDEFRVIWYEWLAEHTRVEIFDAAAAARFPVAPVYDAADMLEDPHLKERGFFQRTDHPEAGGIVAPGLPFRPHVPAERGGEGGERPPGRAPLLGEHTAQVLAEVGVASDKGL